MNACAAATRIVRQGNGHALVLRGPAAPRGVPREVRDGGKASGWGRGSWGFWNKVAKLGLSPGGCWEWTGYLDRDGYGKFTSSAIDGRPRSYRPHRLLWEQENGDIPAGLSLMSLCGNRCCVAPHHHRLDTQGEIIRACFALGRHENKADNRGELSPRARLTNDAVRDIRSYRGVYGAAVQLARIYGVSANYVRALYRRGWSHLRRPGRPMVPLLSVAQLRELADTRERERSGDAS